MVRPSAPRFLNFGDQFELPVVLQNQTDEDLEVDVGDPDRQPEPDRRRRPAGHRARQRPVEVRFPAAAEDAGTARFQVAAVSGDLRRRRHRLVAGLHAGNH